MLLYTHDTEFPHHFSTQNRSNNLLKLPDLDSNRISIRSPIISSDILCRFTADFVSGCFSLVSNVIFLVLLRSINFRSVYNTDSQSRLKDARILFKDWVPHGNSHCKYFTRSFPCCFFKCLLFSLLCMCSFSLLIEECRRLILRLLTPPGSMIRSVAPAIASYQN